MIARLISAAKGRNQLNLGMSASRKMIDAKSSAHPIMIALNMPPGLNNPGKPNEPAQVCSVPKNLLRVRRIGNEPDLGMVLSADLRDTTQPLAMAQLVRRITTRSLLQQASRDRLLGWMENTQTGPRRLRAGLPKSWRIGNKTGTGRAQGTTNKCNDITIVFVPICCVLQQRRIHRANRVLS
jgi:hypothetical protein